MRVLLLPIAALLLIAAKPADRAGLYDGGQTEMAAVLELRKDGIFGFALSYGALDEAAEGHWREEGGKIILTPTQAVSNDPYGEALGETSLAIEDDVLILPRHDRTIRFRREEK